MSAQVATAQAQIGTVHAVTYLDLSPASVEASRTLLGQYRDAMLAQGALVAQAYAEIARPGRFAIRALWQTLPALEANVASESTRKLASELEKLQLAPADPRRHDGFSIGLGAADAGPDAVYVLTHVDVPPPLLAGLEPMLKQVAEASRMESGAIAFDVLQQTSRKNHFTVFECWRTHGAFDAHASGAAARAFRLQLGPMLGALYDQRLYRLVA